MVRLRVKLSIKIKYLLYSAVAVIMSFLAINYVWYYNTKDLAELNSSQYLSFAVTQAQKSVDTFINSKLIELQSHSQDAAILSGDNDLISEDLDHLRYQDTDILSISYVDAAGRERLRLPSNKAVLKNYSTDPLFAKITTQKESYAISSLAQTAESLPYISIALPIIDPHEVEPGQSLTDKTRLLEKGKIYGAIIANVSVSNLFNNINITKIGESGSMYIVDANTLILSHPNKSFINHTIADQNTEFAAQLNQSLNSGMQSKLLRYDNQKILFSDKSSGYYMSASLVPWVVVAEQPDSEVIAQSEKIQQNAAFIFLIPFLGMILLSFVLATHVTNPIRKLVRGIQNFSRGEFDQPLDINTGDELEILADEFTKMSKNLKQTDESLKIQLEESKVKNNTIHTVLSNIANGVVALDSAYRVVIFNTAAEIMTQIPASQAISMPFSEVMELKSQDELISVGENAAKFDSMTEPLRCTFFNTQQQRKVVNLKIALVPPSQTSQIRYIITLEDITHEQELESMKLDFVSMAAHELRTPLTAMKGYLSVLGETVNSKLTEEEQDALARVVVSTDQLEEHIENLLNVTKIERGSFKIEFDYMSMPDTIQKVVNNLNPLAKQKNIQITFLNQGESFPTVHADPYRITEVLTNLLTNAITYTNQGGKIELRIQLTSSEIIVSVKDTGVGIPANSLPHLFTKFYRVGGPLIQGSRGTGLGLYISKSIIDQHNGRIWVESAEGQGSTFSFALPMISH